MDSSCSDRGVCIRKEGSFLKHFIEMTQSGCQILAVCVALVKSKKKKKWSDCATKTRTVHKVLTLHKPPYSVFIQLIYKAKNNNHKGILICNMQLALSLFLVAIIKTGGRTIAKHCWHSQKLHQDICRHALLSQSVLPDFRVCFCSFLLPFSNDQHAV